MDGWMDGLVGWMDGLVDGLMAGSRRYNNLDWMNGSVYGWGGWVGWMDGLVDGWMDGMIDGWIKKVQQPRLDEWIGRWSDG